ncbi:MAG: hypothetical protein KZQ58_12430 [gamma proteobacterium symbiont of Bathyaustriella thionipta]|nr:hypothetical protein [gamma proteobacterium symbiont of Bathyaustriella thionipta]
MNNSLLNSSFFELCLNPHGHHIRIDLHRGIVTSLFIDSLAWHVDTREQQISEQLSHFVQPDGRIVGTRTVTDGDRHE